MLRDSAAHSFAEAWQSSCFSILSATATRAETVLHQRMYLLLLGEMKMYPRFLLHKETPYLIPTFNQSLWKTDITH